MIFILTKEVQEKKTGSSTINNNLTKIGLIYESDYAFATSMKNECSIIGTWNTNCSHNNWLYKINEFQWSLTVQKYSSNQVWFICNSTSVQTIGINNVTNKDIAVFPSFYLKSNVLFQNGNGTHDNPYRISINN